jgi:hypothetical protein
MASVSADLGLQTACTWRSDSVRQPRAALERAHPKFSLEAVIKHPRLLFEGDTLSEAFGEAMAIVAADSAADIVDPKEPAILSIVRTMLARAKAGNAQAAALAVRLLASS